MMCSAGYLSDFEEFRNPSHSRQESFVDLQPVFTLAPLHLKKFFLKKQIRKRESLSPYSSRLRHRQQIC